MDAVLAILQHWFFVVSKSTIFTLAAGLASILGLIYSFRAFGEARTAAAQARTAAVAAQQARDSILSKGASEELEQTCLKLDQLRDFVQDTKVPEAILRANEIIASLSEFRERRAAHFDEQGRDSIVGVRGQVQIVREVLSKAITTPLTLKKKHYILRILEEHGIVILRAQLGKIKDRDDRERPYVRN